MSKKGNTGPRNKIFSETSPEAQTMPSTNVTRDDFGWDVPVQTVPVPSKGVVYPNGSALHGLETLDIRAMTAREEDILTSQALIKRGVVITHLLQSVVLTEGVEISDMLLGDRNALMVATRITGYGSSYVTEVRCPACTEKNRQDIDLSDLPLKRLEIDPVTPGQNLFEFTLPVSKKVVQFHFLTGQEEKELASSNERRQKLMPDMDVTSLVTSRLESMIVSIDSVTSRPKLSSFIRSMPAYDSRSLRKYIEKNEPGIEMKAWIKCPSCSETSSANIPIGTSFFWPEL